MTSPALRVAGRIDRGGFRLELDVTIEAGEVVARVGATEVRARLAGILRGMLYPGLEVAAGTKLGDIDPRAEPAHVLTVSDKSLAIGGGVLEAILAGL